MLRDALLRDALLRDALLRDALLRTLQAADIAGIRALLVHAPHERATAFYRARGFAASPFDPLVLFLAPDHVGRLFAGA